MSSRSPSRATSRSSTTTTSSTSAPCDTATSKRSKLGRVLRPDAHGAGRRPDAAAPRRQRGSARSAARTARSSTRSSRSTASGSITPSSSTPSTRGADIYKIHVPTRKIVRLTDQTFTPNTGAADWSKDFRTPEKGKTSLRYGVFNLGPCPLPGGKVVFTSNRNAFVPPRGYPADHAATVRRWTTTAANVEQIGYLNLACALHPVILKDGRVMFSSLESQGMHNSILWGIWSIHPDGTNWDPVVSAFATGGAPSGFHFQTQLSDGASSSRSTTTRTTAASAPTSSCRRSRPTGTPAFGPG